MKRLALILMIAAPCWATVPQDYAPVSYAANGSTKIFTFDWPIVNESDLIVTVVDDDGNEEIQTLNSDYTLSATSNTYTEAGGTVTFVTAPDDGYTVTLTRETSQDQDRTSSALSRPAQISGGMDKLTRIVQELQQQIKQALRTTTGGAAIDMNLPAGWYNETGYPYWDGSEWDFGDPVSTSVVASAFGESLVQAASSAAARILLGLVIGTNVQAYDADLTTWAGITPHASWQDILDGTTTTVANLRTAAAQMGRPFINVVTDYGATGNGTTDDSTTIQAAIDAAEVAGGTVFFPKGTYIINAALTVQAANVTLIGEGKESILKCKASTSINLITVGDANDLTIERLALDGNLANNAFQNTSSIQNGIYVVHTVALHDLRFIDLYIHDCYYDGIRFSGATVVDRVWVERCYVEGTSRVGMTLTNCTDLHVTNCTIDDSGRTGIACANIKGELTISGCDINDVDNAQPGIYVIGGAADAAHTIRLINNHVTDDGDGGHGINVSAYATDIIISNNVASGWLYDGLNIDAGHDDANWPAYATITGNISHDNTVHGISFRNASYGSVTGNTAYANGHSGLNVNATGATVTGNTSYGNTNYGIYLNGCIDTLAASNNCYENDYGIYTVDANGVSLYANRLLNNTTGPLYEDTDGYGLTKGEMSVYNVRDYGAAGNGTTDDSSAVQAALDASNGGHIFFPAGTYSLETALTFSDDGMTLQGVPGKTTLKIADSVSINIIEANDVSSLTVRDLLFDGNKAGTADAGDEDVQNGIRIINDSAQEERLVFENLLFQNFYSDPIIVEANEAFDTQDVKFLHCSADTVYRGFKTIYCGRVILQDCHVNDTESGAIYLDQCHDGIIIEACDINDVGGLQNGIMVRGYGPTLSGGGASTADDCNGVRIAMNRLVDDGGGGFAINTSGYVQRQTIVGNTVTGPWTYDGISANQGFLSDPNTGQSLSSITGNTVVGVTQYGISVRSGKQMSVMGNLIYDTSYAGIFIGGRDTNNVTVTGNQCHTNTYYGIYVNDVNDLLVSSNSCSENVDGIYMRSCVGRVVVAGNYIHDNSRYGINVQATMSDVVIGTNYYSNNTSGNLYDAGATAITKGLVFLDMNISPTVPGELLYDNNVTGFTDGLLEWYDDDAIRYIVDLDSLPGDTEDDKVVAYDKDADKFYMKADAGSGAAGTVTTIESGGVGVGDADIVTVDFNDVQFNVDEDVDTHITIDVNEVWLATFAASDPNSHDAVTLDVNMATLGYLTGQAIEVNLATPADGVIALSTADAIYDWVIGLGYITEDPNSHDAVTLDVNMATVGYLTGQAIEVNLATPADGVIALSTADAIYDWVIGLGYITADPNTHDAVTLDPNFATLGYLTGQAMEVNLATPADNVIALCTADGIYDWVIGLGYITADPNSHDAATVADTNTVDATLSGQQISAAVLYQDTATILLSEDASGLKADANTAAVADGATTLATGDQIRDYVVGLGYITEDPNTHDAVTVTDTTSVDLTLAAQVLSADVNETYLGTLYAPLYADPNYAQLVTVSSAGADYTTIQDAIDSIGDNATGKRYTVLIYPGIYTENVVMEEYVSLVGTSRETTTITSASGATVTAPAGTSEATISNLTLASTPTADGAVVLAVSNGSLDIINSNLEYSSDTAGVAGNLMEQSGGETIFKGCSITYVTTGSTGSDAEWQNGFYITGTSQYHIRNCEFTVDVNDEDDYIVGINQDSGATITESFLQSCIFHVVCNNPAYEGSAGVLYPHGAGTDKTVKACHLHISSDGDGTGYVVYMDTSGGAGVMTIDNSAGICEGFASNYAGSVGSGDTINLAFTSITAADGWTGAGTVNSVSSNAPGSLTATGTIDAAYLTVSGTDVNAIYEPIGGGAAAVLAHNVAFDHNDIADGATAYGWGDHAGLYDPLGAADANIATHNGAYDHNDIATAYQPGDEATIAGIFAPGDYNDLSVTAADMAATLDLSAKTITLPARTAGDDKTWRFTVVDPNALYVSLTVKSICLDPNTHGAITVNMIEGVCNADPTTELDMDLMFADTYIGKANATKIADIASVAGVIDVTSFNDATIPAGKAVYLLFQANPDVLMEEFNLDIYWKWD